MLRAEKVKIILYFLYFLKYTILYVINKAGPRPTLVKDRRFKEKKVVCT